MINAPDDAVESLIQREAFVKEMIESDPEILLVLKTAALFTDSRDRWQMYEELKRRGSSLVGWGAGCAELQTTRHYEAFIDAIDSLLPKEA